VACAVVATAASRSVSGAEQRRSEAGSGACALERVLMARPRQGSSAAAAGAANDGSGAASTRVHARVLSALREDRGSEGERERGEREKESRERKREVNV